MNEYTVVGFFPDTSQRSCGLVQSLNPELAEMRAAQSQPTLVVVAVFPGYIYPVDERTHIDDFGA
jgi:hypothetical protein